MNKAKRLMEFAGSRETSKGGRELEGPVILSDQEAFIVMDKLVGGIHMDDLDLYGSKSVAQDMLDTLNKMQIKLMKE